MNISIDVVSDIVCPWCFIGKRRLTAACDIVREKTPDISIQVNWLPFFLNPDTPARGVPYRAFLESKFGGGSAVDQAQADVANAGRESGVEFNFDRIAVLPNTSLAHGLIYRAQSIGHRSEKVEALIERLYMAHFQQGEDIGNIDVLVRIAEECGDRPEEVAAFLSGNGAAQQVQSLVGKVGKLGVTGVPFFVFQRRLTMSGAQSPTRLAAAIMQAMSL